MFKINKIKVSKTTIRSDRSFFYLDINFSNSEISTEEEKDDSFGELGNFRKAFVILDPEAMKKYEADSKNSECTFESIPNSNNVEIKFKTPTLHELGIKKLLPCEGRGKIHFNEDGTFNYSEYISSSYITKACVRQLKQMKKDIDDYLSNNETSNAEVGAFRSGSAWHDFLAAIEAIDNFWD